MSHDRTKDFKHRLSREKGTIIKDWGGRLPIALIYPNSYYLGMSSLGIHTIYRLLNSYPDIVCERVFWERENARQQPPLSLESRRPLADFAVLAFSVTYELDYFNVIKLLKASNIPVYAADRDEKHPLLIAGGPCITANPLPLAPIFDCLCIGEAEPILPGILPVVAEGIKDRREELLQAMASLPGVYVPRCHDGSPVVRQWLVNLDDCPTTSAILTPDTELGDLYLIEVERGCHWGCRFCLVNNIFRPRRFRSVDKLLEQARTGLQYRQRLGLVGPSVSSHPRFEELLLRLRGLGAELAVSSLRIKPLATTALKALAEGGARTISLAPEAGSPRLRQLIKKGISEEDILETIRLTAEQGIRNIKLYFMIGLPSETDDDIEAIIELVLKSKTIVDRQGAGSRLTLGIAPFVPKANTPFQWLPMELLPVLNKRLARLKNRLTPPGIKLKSESPAWSQVQGVLSRGNVELAGALVDTEELSLSGWRRAVTKNHIDSDFYIRQRWDITQRLPWSVLDTGADPVYLSQELARALGEPLPIAPKPNRAGW